MLLALFLDTLGPTLYRDMAWPTWDRVIPWTAFFGWLTVARRIRYQRRVEWTTAYAHAMVFTQGSKEGATLSKQEQRKWERLAYKREAE